MPEDKVFGGSAANVRSLPTVAAFAILAGLGAFAVSPVRRIAGQPAKPPIRGDRLRTPSRRSARRSTAEVASKVNVPDSGTAIVPAAIDVELSSLIQ